MNGWDEPTMARLVKNCLNNPKNCGGSNLGDGEKMYGVNED
jgi:predicted transcriptional regulator of viral defense system